MNVGGKERAFNPLMHGADSLCSHREPHGKRPGTTRLETSIRDPAQLAVIFQSVVKPNWGLADIQTNPHDG